MSIDSDQNQFKIDVAAANDVKANQVRNKNQHEQHSVTRKEIDDELNAGWKSGTVSDDMIKAVKEVYPGIESKGDLKKSISYLMNAKKPDGKKRFENFEDFRHWAIAKFGHSNYGK